MCSLCFACFCAPIAIPAIFLCVVLCCGSHRCCFCGNFLLQMAADDRAKGEGWQTQKRKGWMSGQFRPEKLVAEAITIDGRKEWYCRFSARSEVSDKHSVSIASEVQEVSLSGSRRCSSDSSSSSGGENKKYKNFRTELQELRARIKRYESAEKKLGTQCELAGEEGGLE